MSHLISDMKLGTPPVIVERLGNVNVTAWRMRCECGYPSKVYPRIGMALEQMAAHGSLHILEQRELVLERQELVA